METIMKVRRWIFIALWILSLISISFFGGAVSYGFFFGMTFIPVILLLYMICVYFGFRIYQKLESRNTVCGEPVPFYFVLQNAGFCSIAGISVRLFSDFSFVEDIPDDIEYELLPGDKFRYETRLVCKYRGEYEVGVKELIVSDFLQLFKLRYKVPGSVKAIVLPKLVRMESLRSIAEITTFLQKESQTDRTEPDILVRDYQSGDSQKRINWKASAREQKLKTRNYIGEEKQGISFILDTRRSEKDIQKYIPIENKMLETLLALGLFFAEKNMPMSVYYSQNGMHQSRVNAMEGFDSFYTEVSRISFGKDENAQMIFDYAFQKGDIFHSKLVLCVLQELNTEIMTEAERLSEYGIVTVLYVISDDSLEDYVRESVERRKVIVIPVEAELEDIL